MITNNLFVIPEPRYFGHSAEAELSRELTRLERTTIVKHVGSPSELCLDRDGVLPGGFRYTEAALELCARQGDRHRQAALHNNLADLLHLAGDRDEAMTHLKQAVAIFAEIGEPGTLEPEIWKLVAW